MCGGGCRLRCVFQGTPALDADINGHYIGSPGRGHCCSIFQGEMIMGDYDLMIMVAVIFAVVLFGGFMYVYAQEPTIDHEVTGNTSHDWDTAQSASGIDGVFQLLDSFGFVEIFLVSLFTSAMGIIGVIIGLRFLRGQ